MSIYECHFDGSAKPNPGEMTIGGVIKDSEGNVVEQYTKPLGYGTNNQAEYLSLIYLLEIAGKYFPDRLIIKGDSALVINQVTGKWKVKDIKIKPLCTTAQQLIELYPDVSLIHVKRNLNSEADSLTR